MVQSKICQNATEDSLLKFEIDIIYIKNKKFEYVYQILKFWFLIFLITLAFQDTKLKINSIAGIQTHNAIHQINGANAEFAKVLQ